LSAVSVRATFEGCADDGVDCCVQQEDGSCVVPATGGLEDTLVRTTNAMSLFAMHGPPSTDLNVGGSGYLDKRQAASTTSYPLVAPAPEGALTVDYSHHMPYPVNQGLCGSCVIFSFTTTALMYTNMFRAEYGDLPPLRADYWANLQCADWDLWEFENSHTWKMDLEVRDSRDEVANTTAFKAAGGLGEALLRHLNGAAGTSLTMANLDWVTLKSGGVLAVGLTTEDEEEGVNPLLTEELWESASLTVKDDAEPVSLVSPSGATYTLRSMRLRASRDICEGAFYHWLSKWQAEQQAKYGAFRRSTVPTTDIGHLPLTLAEGTPDIRIFGPVDRTECNNERVLAQRGGEPSVDDIVSMSSMATQLLDERVQGFAVTELDVSVRMPTKGDKNDPTWVSWVTNSSYNLMYALTRFGPVSVALNVCSGFSRLLGPNVAQDFDCTRVAGHQVVFAGFDFDPDRPIWENYFIVVNSWGAFWGVNGVGRVAFGSSALKSAVVPIYSLRVPEYPFVFNHDRFTTFDEALRNKHVYAGSVTAQDMFERERGIVPIPTGYWEASMWRLDNPTSIYQGALDPPVGPGRWTQLPTDGSPARRRLMHMSQAETGGYTMSALPRLIAETLNIVVTVADEDMRVVRGSTLRLRVNVWSAYAGGLGRESRPIVYPLGTIAIDGDSFRQEACDGNMAACSRWLGAATFVMRPDIVTAREEAPTDELFAQMLPGDEWRAIEFFAEWTGKAQSANVPVYYYGGSIRINEPASEYYGTAFIDQGERLPFAQLKVFDESAFDNVPAGWRTGEAGVGVETDGGLSASTIAIIVGGAVCAIALCASAACIALVVARRASTSQSRRLAAANIAQTPGGGRSRSHSRTRSRRVSEKHLARF
jgi:hypothetical protein